MRDAALFLVMCVSLPRSSAVRVMRGYVSPLFQGLTPDAFQTLLREPPLYHRSMRTS